MRFLLDIPIDSYPDHNKLLLTALCQELGEFERLGAKSRAQLRRLEHLSRRAPAEQPGNQLRECVNAIDHHRPILASGWLLILEGIMLALAHPASDAYVEAYSDVHRRWRSCWS